MYRHHVLDCVECVKAFRWHFKLSNRAKSTMTISPSNYSLPSVQHQARKLCPLSIRICYRSIWGISCYTLKRKQWRVAAKKNAVPTEEKSVTTATTDRHLFRIAPTVDQPLSYPPWCWRHCWEQNNGNIFTFSMARTPPSSSSNIYTRECVHNF